MKALKDKFFRKKKTPETFYISPKKKPLAIKVSRTCNPPIIDSAFYGKATYRLFMRSKRMKLIKRRRLIAI
jgi:hypothetical protein